LCTHKRFPKNFLIAGRKAHGIIFSEKADYKAYLWYEFNHEKGLNRENRL
jgi:hypothetical protein